MKTQISRNSRQIFKNYSSVCHQQGRMLTDSDLTEQALLSRDRLNQALRDVIGSGTPRHDALLQVTEVDGELLPSLHWGDNGGLVYVDGVPAEVRADESAPDIDIFDYEHQLDYPMGTNGPSLPDSSSYRLYVDVWDRAVTWLEDEVLRDPGLHGADTTTRTQTVAQVKWCDVEVDPLCPDVNPPIGNALLRLVLRSLATSADPCDPCADELELNDSVGNYLFRVEVHDVSYDENNQPEAVVLKWSSENAAEAYKTIDVPPDFASNQYVYEFFDDVTEKRLGVHLAHNGANQRLVDGKRPSLVETFLATSSEAKTYVRRWNGWCKLEKSGSDWQLVSGFERNIDLSSGVGAGRPGHVTQGGDAVQIELREITLNLELADKAIIAGDFWTAPVRESVHRKDDVLLEDEAGKGKAPEGEQHHYMLLVDVVEETMSLPDGSECDTYNACKPAQFPSLTDLRADDICYDNNECMLPEVRTVQDALDHLCQENDLPWHNKHLHGWGIVCGLTLQCDRDNPRFVNLLPGYALDCEGRDMVIEDKGDDIGVPIDVMKLAEAEKIDLSTLDENDGLCLYLKFNEKNQLDIGMERYENEDEINWVDKIKETLFYDLYNGCIKGFIDTISGNQNDDNVEAQCTKTFCGHELVKPARRRTLTILNIAYSFDNDSAKGSDVLNISACEHALLEDSYNKIKEDISSKTFCGQFQHQTFPEYPFNDDESCRSTWFTPGRLDHIRIFTKQGYLLGWKRDSSRVYIFKQLAKEQCTGDLIGFFEVQQLENGSISDVLLLDDGTLLVTGIVHENDTLFAKGELPTVEEDKKQCEIKINWQISFLCGVRIVQLKQSPWKDEVLFAVGRSVGVFLLGRDSLFKNEKLELEPNWSFLASGQIELDIKKQLIYATADGEVKTDEKFKKEFQDKNSSVSNEGVYNHIAKLEGGADASPENRELPVTLYQLLSENKVPIRGIDNFVLQPESRGNNGILYLVFDNNKNKSLYAFQIADILKDDSGESSWHGRLYHSFGEGKSSHISIKYMDNGKMRGIIAARYLQNDLQFIPADLEDEDQVIRNIPVQQGPVDIALNIEEDRLYVLNYMGDSITVLRTDLSIYEKSADVLSEYRAQIVTAYFQLLSNLMQFMKDCFCEHLLVSCPECTKGEKEKVYLGCLSLRDNEIYNICNFTKRKYVKSFPTLAYWFSLIPVAPLVSWGIEKFCCAVLPGFSTENDSFRKNIMLTPFKLRAVQTGLNADFGNAYAEISTEVQNWADEAIKDAVTFLDTDVSNTDEYVGNEYNYRPGLILLEESHVAHGSVAINAEIKEKIANIEHNDRVNKEDIAKFEKEVKAIRDEKSEMEERLKTLAEADKRESIEKVALLEKEISDLKAERVNSENRVVELENRFSEFELVRREIQPIVERRKPVSTIEGITPANAKILKENNITTIELLAETDAAKLKELGVDSRTATSLIKKAKKRITLKP